MDMDRAARIVAEAVEDYVLFGALELQPMREISPADKLLLSVETVREFLGSNGPLGFLLLDPGDYDGERLQLARSTLNAPICHVVSAADVEADEEPKGATVYFSLQPIEVTTASGSTVTLRLSDLIHAWMTEDGGDRAEAAAVAFGPISEQQTIIDPIRQDTKPIRHQLMPTGKVFSVIRDAPQALYDNDTNFFVDVASDSEKALGKEVRVALSMDIEQTGAEISRELSQLDVDMHNALLSLWFAGNKAFTYQQIWRSLTGSSKRPTEQQLDRVKESCDTLRRAFTRFDWTAQARARGYDVERATVKDFLISAREVDIELTNGSTARGLVMTAPPLLYEYASRTGELTSVPQRLLNTDKAGQDSTAHIVIKRYLLQRIAGYRNHKEKAERHKRGKTSETTEDDTRYRRIKYDTICSRAGIDPTDRMAKKRAIDYTIECLKLWREQGFISGHKEIKQGTGARAARVAVEIKL